MACFAYNTSVHSTTGYTPFLLMHGYEARLPVDIIFGSGSKEKHSLCDYVTEVQDRLEATFQKVQEKTGQEQKKQKTYYDRKIHGNTLEEGELVWLWNPAIPRKRGYCRKFHRSWQGPYRILKKLSDVTYRIQHTAKKRNRQIVHFDRLKRCVPGVRMDCLNPPQDPMIPSELLQTNSQTPVQEEEEEEDEIVVEMPKAPQQLRPQTLIPEHQEVGQEVRGVVEGQTTTADLAPDAQVEYRETPTPEELPADQPDIHNQEQPEENQDDVQVDEQQQHRYPTRQKQEPVRYGNYIKH